MSAKVKLQFVKRHGWHRPLGFYVYHDTSWRISYQADLVTGVAVRLWRYGWEKAGFGHGRFGYRSFGWAQGGLTSGGFGYGRFGEGEFGYYNEVMEWEAPKRYQDGRHTFGVELVSTNYQIDFSYPEQTIVIMSKPAAPLILELVSMESGEARLRWSGSEDLVD